MSKTQANIAPEQREYMKADSHLRQLQAKIQRSAPKAPAHDSPEFDSWFDDYESYLMDVGYYSALDAATAAGDAMIAWAKKVMQSHPVYGPRFDEVSIVFEKAPRNVKHREKLLAMCVKLAI